MKSMTGYGKGVSLRDNRELVVELKSVNHRFLDISTKMSRMFLFAEDIVRNMISQQVTRGHIDIYVKNIEAKFFAKLKRAPANCRRPL